ncbi:MAG: alpha/beta hydrolase family esterase [Allosphingosinicella sp.]|uniref:extracellular catalytic domain type 1 short-chain-length polyhydroxyalkanoate depolymerase n=1 Tax=Allosphingosinicella sp. TaxID=2823234 RepID=UPI0039505324
MPVIRPRIRLRRSRMGASAFAPPQATNDRLRDLERLRDNPGNLVGRYYVPATVQTPAPLVVVLHGCTQNAAVYDHGSGWSTLADRHGFILLFPEQQRANNPLLCFNWFDGRDSRRELGEAASIRAMIEAMKAKHAIDPRRIFVTGLSAGGAMTSVMLATYPETFAAGAILAGVAYGCAGSVGEAFDCMAGRATSGTTDLAGEVRRASPHEGPWPRVQVWQGSADPTVVPSNADAIVRQWTALHGLAPEPDRIDRVAGHPRRAWHGPDGAALIEHVSVTGMGHGVPLASGGAEPVGAAGAHMLDVGLSSTEQIAAFFGLAGEGAARTRTEPPAPPPRRAAPQAAAGPQEAIERALRAAGLLR